MLRPWRLYRAVVRWASLDSRCLSRSLLPVLVGLCLGMTVSMMYAPFSEDSCETYLANQDPQKMVNLRNTKSVADPPSQDDQSIFEPRLLVPRSVGGGGPGENAAAPGANIANNNNNNAAPAPPAKVEPKAAGGKFFRPKFAATELGIRQKLFVAVLSSRDTLNTLAVAVNRTLAHYVTKTVYFIDQKSASVPTGMVIVNFADGYNHLLPVNVFKYVIKKYGRGYDYYLFITDRAYVRAERVHELVSHISVSRHVHMGAPKGVEANKPYCTLEGGIILSQSVLTQVNASMKWCSDNCHHLDQNLNFGKCVLYASNLHCSKSKSVYETHSLTDFDYDRDILALREQIDFNKSFSVFPMPNEITHYKLHRYFCEVELNSTRHQIEDMKKDILYMCKACKLTGVPEPYKPKNRFDVIRWDYFTETHIFFQDDFTNVKELIGADKMDIQDIIKVSIEKLNEKHDNKYLYSYLINGYRRFDPQRGMEYVMDLALEDTTLPSQEDNIEVSYKSKIVEKRVFLVRPLGEVEVVPMPYVTESTRIYLVLPVLASDADSWGLFLETYSALQAKSEDSLALILIFMYEQLPKAGENDVFSVLKSMVGFYNDKNENGVKTSTISFATNGTYVPEYKIIDLVSKEYSSTYDALILTCTMGMQLNQEMLNRVRINTVEGWQVFFPVGFWQFKPNLIYDKKPYPTEIEFNSKAGHYDVLSYEHGSFYNSDYKAARRSLTASQLANCDVYEMFVKNGNIHLFRAVEPEFKHFYMQLECMPGTPVALHERCMERKSLNLATRAQLAKRIFQYKAK
ncbi:hypothetical protein EGW08_009312, partial [Elysia chlorotica]